MTPIAGITPLRATAAEPTSFVRVKTVRSTLPRTRSVRETLHGDVYLFIYRIRHRYNAYAWVDSVRYCTVFALGNSFANAESVAINSVHQHGWHILKIDTATAFSPTEFGDGGADAAHIGNLHDYGVSFKLNR